MFESLEIALEFSHETCLTVLPGGELQAAEELRRLVHERSAHAT